MARRREAMTESFRVRVTPTLRVQVEEIAEEQDLDTSDVIRDALKAHVEEHWKPKRRKAVKR